MFFSISSPVTDGVTSNFAVPFPYLDQSHVFVFVDDTSVPFTFTSPSQVEITGGAPAASSTLVIRRVTPVEDLLATIGSRSTLKSSELNRVNLQLLYVVQESFDAALALNDIAAQIAGDAATVAANAATVATSLATILNIASGIAYQYDAIFSIPYTPVNNERVAVFPIVRSVTLPAGAVGSEVELYNAASSNDVIFSIRKNNVEVGTLTFANGSTTGVWAIAADVDFASGDDLSFVCTQADASFSNVGVTLKLQRNGDIA